MDDSLLDKRFLIVTGKGGAGKSSLAAALALCAARRGKRVLLCEVGNQERLGSLLGVEPAEAPTPSPRRAAEGVHTLRVTPADAMREYGLLKLRFEVLYKAVFESALVRAFLRLVPSLNETVVLGKVWYEVVVQDEGRPRWDLVILDAPASGHAIPFLRVPRTLLETVPPGPMREEAERMQSTLTDPALTSLQVVTLPEEMSVNEALDLVQWARAELEVPLGSVFLNAYVPPGLTPAEVGALEAALGFAPAGEWLQPATAAAHAGILQARREARSERYRDLLAQRLPELPLTLVPRLSATTWGRAQIEQLAAALAAPEPQP